MTDSRELQIDTDLQAEDTANYVVGAKKTVDEYAQLDANDESLRKWKESLGLVSGANANTIGDPSDTRRVVILEMRVEIEGREPLVFNLEDPATFEKLKKKGIVIKEKANYHITAKFRVQHEIVTGLKYLQSVKRAGVRVDRFEEICGSYGPNTKGKPYYEKSFQEEEAPSGLLARGSYEATSKFVDDDKTTYLEFPWVFEIKKTWE
ncbi:E set domain-containing protein [Nadsonia fulvescens var. elongata DSM 6958]|uniref:Rho GDP-dissociation inhibitor n=1 Tax=Nadsonia fulvescens var. elongata DSM 6958 TaxID=857566 RepID=A0A1E3PJY0_9ASCO|nr:E set domain-containing protein [Nadsonia fulvescens var. elongata DSM 6958]